MDESTTEKVYEGPVGEVMTASEIDSPAVMVVVAAIVVRTTVVRSTDEEVGSTVSVMVTFCVTGTKTVLGAHDAARVLV